MKRMVDVKLLEDKIGNLDNLTTQDKTSIVNAINEVASSSGGGGSKLVYAGLGGRLFEGDVDIRQNDVLVLEYYTDDDENKTKNNKVKLECIVDSFTFDEQTGAGSLVIKNVQLSGLTMNIETFQFFVISYVHRANYTINITMGNATASLILLAQEMAVTDSSGFQQYGYAYLIRP